MDTAIVAAIIGGVAVIIAAIIGFMKKKDTSDASALPPRQLYILGTNIAKVGWAKAMPNPASHNIMCSTIALLEHFKLPMRLTKELETFGNTKESIRELTISLPRIKNLFGNYLASQFGKSSAEFFYTGFNLVNICPMFELASLKIKEVGPIAIRLMNEIETSVHILNLPIKELKAIQKLAEQALAEEKGELFDKARVEIIKVGESYIDLLEKRGKDSI